MVIDSRKHSSIRFTVHTFLLFACWSLFVCSVYSQQKTAVRDSVELGEIKVIAARYPQSLRMLSVPFQVVGRNWLNNITTGDLSAALAPVSGVQLQTGTAQTLKLTIRGIGSRSQYGTNRTRVYINDIPLTGGDGTSVFDDLDLAFISRAEITKGPYAAWYGSGMGGAVRFSTRRSESDVSVSSGSFGLLKLSGIATADYTSGLMTAGVSYYSGDGYRENSSFRRLSGLITGAHTFPVAGKLSWQLMLSDVKAFTPSSIDESTYRNSPWSAASNWFSVKGFKEYKRLLSGLKLESRLYNNWTNSILLTTNYYDQLELRPFNILDDQSAGFSLQESVRFTAADVTIIAGVEASMEKYMWKTKSNGTEEVLNDALEWRRHFNAFASLEYNPDEKIKFTLAGNFNQTVYQLLHHSQPLLSSTLSAKPVFSPMTGITYNISPHFSLVASAGHGFSIPTVEESLRSDGSMNVTLRPEKGWTLDAGIKSRLPDSRLSVQVSAYSIFLADLLVTVRPEEDVFYGENAGKAVLRGVEAIFNYHPTDWITGNLSTSFSDNRFRTFSEDEDYSGNKLPGIPDFQLFSSVTATFTPSISLVVALRATGQQFADDANSVEIEGWKTVDTSLNYAVELMGGQRLEAQLSINNIADEHYASMILINAPAFGSRPPRYYYPAQPRNFGVKLSYKW